MPASLGAAGGGGANPGASCVRDDSRGQLAKLGAKVRARRWSADAVHHPRRLCSAFWIAVTVAAHHPVAPHPRLLLSAMLRPQFSQVSMVTPPTDIDRCAWDSTNCPPRRQAKSREVDNFTLIQPELAIYSA